MKRFISLIGVLVVSLTLWAQELALPQPMQPARLVNDFAKILTPQERQALEYPLREYHDSTSTQIAVVTVPTLQGLEINEFATRLFNEWGIGGESQDNGVLILILPKTPYQDGQAYISTGYGAEGALPDAVCYDIVNNEMIPYFRENSYYGGIRAAIGQIMPILKGEFSAEEYQKQQQREEMMSNIFDMVIIAVFLIILFISYRKQNKGGDSNNSGGSSSGGPFVGGYWGPFGGGSSGGSFGGGFGGFGGGSSGGGGAGGRW